MKNKSKFQIKQGNGKFKEVNQEEWLKHLSKQPIQAKNMLMQRIAKAKWEAKIKRLK